MVSGLGKGGARILVRWGLGRLTKVNRSRTYREKQFMSKPSVAGHIGGSHGRRSTLTIRTKCGMGET